MIIWSWYHSPEPKADGAKSMRIQPYGIALVQDYTDTIVQQSMGKRVLRVSVKE